jgi:hypothetical protein
MSTDVGVWQPGKPVQVDVEKLRNYVGVMAEVNPEKLADALGENAIREDAGIMKQPAEAWQAAASLSDAELVALIRFFTLAEMQLDGWHGGKESPVIALVRILKERGGFTADLRKWIKANTDNRYLPYGSVL